jgi:hypothetical protein
MPVATLVLVAHWCAAHEDGRAALNPDARVQRDIARFTAESTPFSPCVLVVRRAT